MIVEMIWECDSNCVDGTKYGLIYARYFLLQTVNILETFL